MMKRNLRHIGRRGEDIAAAYLLRNGYQVMERNWRWGRQEIDIIARKGNYLVVVEVKSRDPSGLAAPEEAVTLAKQRILTGAANAFVRYKLVDLEVRFDIIGIIFTRDGPVIRHVEDAFSAVLSRQ